MTLPPTFGRSRFHIYTQRYRFQIYTSRCRLRFCEILITMLSKTAEYALRAVAFLAARDHQPASADLLALKTKVPRRYLQRVLQDLVAAEIVISRPGPGGGYELIAATDELTIFDIVNAVAPLERIRECPLGLKTHTELCPLHAELDRAYAATEAAFKAVTIEQLASSTSSIIPLCESE
jgi:Rrf2 family transcriptional regulator, nitric oxide-sensitive transcriptional repressor